MGYGLVLWFVVVVCGFHRKIRLTQLWVELSWVVAICIYFTCLVETIDFGDSLNMNIYDL